MGAVVGVGLLASLSICEPIGFPAAEPIDTTVWLAATAGDTLTVTDVTGQELSGSVLGITSDSLSVWTSAGVVDVSKRDVRLVRHRFADPLGDGTIKGLWVGLGSAFLMYFLAQNDLVISDLTSANSLRFMAGILTLGGLAIGRGIDSKVLEERVIYRAPSRSRTTLTPLLSKDAIGAGVTVAW